MSLSGKETFDPAITLSAVLTVAVVSLAAVGNALASSAPTYTVQRFGENPIIRPEMLPGSDGSNIAGPSLIEVPDWVPNRLGRYYLYFAAHSGSYIRMAYADELQGPWTVYAPGVLTLEQVRQQAEKQAVAVPRAGTPHIASPDVHVDDVNHVIRMYFHARPVDPYIDWEHATGIAVSDDGLNFSLESSGPVGEPYFRVFRYQSYYYAVTNRAHLQRSVDGINWESTVSTGFVGDAVDPVTGAEPRHSAIKLDGDLLSVFYTRVNDAPERVMVSTVDLSGDWTSWRLGPPTMVLAPEMDYEGVGLPIEQSRDGPCNEAQNALRDPAIYREADRVYLLYTCKCEIGGIAIGELSFTDEIPMGVDLSVRQSDSPDPVPVSATVLYRSIVANTSPADALYVTFVDQLAPNASFVSATPSQGRCTRSSATVTCLLGTIPAGATATIDVLMKATAAGSLTNLVSVSGNETDPDWSNNSDDEPTVVNPSLVLPSLYVSDAAVLEGMSGTATASFTVWVSSAPSPGQSVTVKYTTGNGSAASGSDYMSVPLTTLTFAAGEWVKTVVVTVNGDTLAEGNETFVVKLSDAVGAVIADNQATGTIIDEEGMITAYIGDVAVLEGMSGTTTASFTVSLSRPPGVGQNVSVKYTTANGTATSGSDYVAVPLTTLPFGVGESSKMVTVAINGDIAAEASETFVVKLSNAVGVVLADKSATGTILNDDSSQSSSSRTIYVSDAAVLEGMSGTTTASFTVWVSSAPASGQSVTVKYTTGNGSAASGSDYMSVPLTTLTFAAGEWVKTVVVTVNGDTLAEGNETFVVKLSNAVGAVIADNQAMGTIIDEEGMITAYIGDVAVLEGTSGTTTASFTVSLSSPPGIGQNVSVRYTTANGTATSGSDYVAVPLTTLPFGVGESSKTVTVAVNGDSLAEAKETFLLKLSNPAGVIVADSQATGTIIADE